MDNLGSGCEKIQTQLLLAISPAWLSTARILNLPGSGAVLLSSVPETLLCVQDICPFDAPGYSGAEFAGGNVTGAAQAGQLPSTQSDRSFLITLALQSCL